MRVKVIAIGNILMRDDAIGIEIVKEIEEALLKKGIEVIYGETDFQYIISGVEEDDYIIILDAACYGKEPGEITFLPINTFVSKKKGYSQHSYSFLELLKLYYPNIKGYIYGIEVKEVEFRLGLSRFLQEKVKYISKEILGQIDNLLDRNYF